jgi:hypothetical protein
MTREEYDGLKGGLKIRKREAEMFIEQNINVEYWQGVKDQAEGTLRFLRACRAPSRIAL